MADYNKLSDVTRPSDPVEASIGPVDKTQKEETVVQAKGKSVPTFWQSEVTHAKAAVKKTWKHSVIPTLKNMAYQAVSSVLSAIIFQDDAPATQKSTVSANTLRVNYGGMFNSTPTTQQNTNVPVYTDNIIIAVNSKQEADSLKEAIAGCVEKYGFASSRALYEMSGLQELAKPIDENYGWKRDSLNKITTRMVDGEWRISMPPRVAR